MRPAGAHRLTARACATIALALLVVLPVVSRADTVASLLGNFTINQYCGLRLGADDARLRYTVVFGQLPALRELHVADTDGDGVTTQAERDAYVAHLAPTFADHLRLAVDGAPVPLRVTHWTTSLPTEQGGFSLRFDVDFVGSLPRSVAVGQHALALANDNFPGRFGWQEIVVEPSSGVSVFATDAFSTSLTADLTEALAALPPGGPLSERAIHLSFTRGAAPAGAQLIAARAGTPPAQARASTGFGTGDATWLNRQTRRLVDLISTRSVAPSIALLALLAAAFLGALHAFSPGHGKTIVGAYLVGSRATLRHAAFLGATVTITHTIGVFALGFATLFASRYVVPERLFPLLSLLSGLLVLGMGVALVVRRWPAARELWTRRPLRTASAYRMIANQPSRRFVMAYPGDGYRSASHRHDLHVHGDHHHSHGALVHSHGGRAHSHLPPGAAGDDVSWKSLLALGVSGGLVPCPSAMVLLLAAIALNKTAYGLALVLAFSVGLAATLIAVGIVFLYARNRIGSRVSVGRFARLLPLSSAAFITLIGAVLCYAAIASTPF